jgi:hypothetical protein
MGGVTIEELTPVHPRPGAGELVARHTRVSDGMHRVGSGGQSGGGTAFAGRLGLKTLGSAGVVSPSFAGVG